MQRQIHAVCVLHATRVLSAPSRGGGEQGGGGVGHVCRARAFVAALLIPRQAETVGSRSCTRHEHVARRRPPRCAVKVIAEPQKSREVAAAASKPDAKSREAAADGEPRERFPRAAGAASVAGSSAAAMLRLLRRAADGASLPSVLGKSTSYTLELLSDDTKAKGKKATGTLEVTIAAIAAAAA